MSSNADIDTALNEQRVFEPSDEFRAKAHIKSLAEYERLYKEAEEHPEKFLGQDRRANCIGSSPGIACSNGSCRSPNGSSAAN